MRLLFVSQGFPPEQRSGTELYVAGVASSLASLGHDVAVFCASPSPAGRVHRREKVGHVDVERFYDPPADDDGAYLRIRSERAEAAFSEALDRLRPDVVHAVSVMLLSHRVISLARARGLPVIVSPTDFWFLCPRIHLPVGRRHPFRGRAWGLACFAHIEGRWPRWTLSLVRRQELADRVRRHVMRANELRVALAQANIVLTPSDFVRRRYIDFGIAPRHIRTVRLGIEAEAHPRGLDAGGPRVGYLGALVHEKGADLLIQAFCRVAPPDARLLVRGRGVGGYVEFLRRLAGVDERVELGPPVDDVDAFLAGLDLLVVPSRVHESFSRVAHEALVQRTPVLAARAGALPEVVAPGRTGSFFRPGSVSSLAAALDKMLVPGALTALKSFPQVKTMVEHAEELLELYASLA